MKYIVGLIFCLFMGITAISYGVGAAYPPINQIAQPFVCAGGKLNYQTIVSHPRPGKTYIQTSWTCVDSSGAKAPIDTFTIALYAGSLYGLVLYGFLAVMLLLGSRRPKAAPKG